MTDLAHLATLDETGRAMEGFAELMAHVCQLYTFGESSSVSDFEALELAESVLYVMGLNDDTAGQTLGLISTGDPVGTWTRRRHALESRIPQVMALWQEVVQTMPAIRNIALRDTLASIGELPTTYDTYFAAHEVPCSIDYPLSEPIPERTRGLDYVEAWLKQLLVEARFLRRFEVEVMVAYLESWCPDYRGLHINLYDPIREAWKKGMLEMSQ